jgi:HD-like signal output (HDOD) protein
VMIAAIVIVIGVLLAGIGGWFIRLKRAAPTGDSAASSGKASLQSLPGRAADGTAAELANREATEKLWKLAFAAPAEAPPLEAAHAKVGDSVCAILQAEKIDAKYFPRRPALMPQLLRAVDDPGAATVKLSRMIAHDPVLAADVLRLANSAVFRTSPTPIETIQRAIVVLGVEALRGLIATAMLQPVFRATRSNFPRFPRLLWERTERSVRAAELYALKTHPQDRFEAQLVILMSALGPLVVYGALLDSYAARPNLIPSPSLCAELTSALGPQVALHIARQWESSPRLVAAIQRSRDETLTTALLAGEMLGTLSALESQHAISADAGLELAESAKLGKGVVAPIWERLTAQ